MMVGNAKKNEYSVATLRSSPASNPPMMVEPDRDMPGISDAHCAMPTQKAWMTGTCSRLMVLLGRLKASTRRMMIPPRIEVRATV